MSGDEISTGDKKDSASDPANAVGGAKPSILYAYSGKEYGDGSLKSAAAAFGKKHRQ